MKSWTRQRREKQGMIRLASLDDPLGIVPSRADGARAMPRGETGSTVEVLLPPRHAVDRFASRWFRMDRRAQINLDPVGTAFWELADGRRNLRQIAAELARRYSFPAGDSRLATLEFAKRLLTRGFLTIHLPDQGDQRTWRAT